jgi:hypothetical protein
LPGHRIADALRPVGEDTLNRPTGSSIATLPGQLAPAEHPARWDAVLAVDERESLAAELSLSALQRGLRLRAGLAASEPAA